METKKTYLKIEYCGDETHVEINGNKHDLMTAMANSILYDKALQVIVIAGLACACLVRAELKDKFYQAIKGIAVKH